MSFKKKQIIVQPSSSEHVESFVQIKVKVTVEVSPDKLVDLVFTLGMEILELVQISPHIETVRCQNVRLPLDQVLTLHPSDLTETQLRLVLGSHPG